MRIVECFVSFYTLLCWKKPSSVLESNISLQTHAIPMHLTKMGCVLFPDSGRELGGPFLPDVPQSLKAVKQNSCIRWRRGQRTGLHVEWWPSEIRTLGQWEARPTWAQRLEEVRTWVPLRFASPQLMWPCCCVQAGGRSAQHLWGQPEQGRPQLRSEIALAILHNCRVLGFDLFLWSLFGEERGLAAGWVPRALSAWIF